MIEMIFEIPFQLGGLYIFSRSQKLKRQGRPGLMQDNRSQAGERENAFY